MNKAQPPRWLQRTLLIFLPKKDRDTIAGDLLEEYREEQLLRLGSLRANLWYLRQLASFPVISLFGGAVVKKLLISSSILIVAAWVWLGLMENVLKHAGYAGRSVIAAGITAQGAATLRLLQNKGLAACSNLILVGALGNVLLGCFSILRILRTAHFEGFVLVIGSSMILQGVLTFASWLHARYHRVI